MTDVMKIISDTSLTYRQQIIALARLAESYDTSLPLTDEEKQMKEDAILCDLNEGADWYSLK